MKKRRPATISLSGEILDLLTPAGVGQRIDATFTNGAGTKKLRVEKVVEPRLQKPKDRRK